MQLYRSKASCQQRSCTPYSTCRWGRVLGIHSAHVQWGSQQPAPPHMPHKSHKPHKPHKPRHMPPQKRRVRPTALMEVSVKHEALPMAQTIAQTTCTPFAPGSSPSHASAPEASALRVLLRLRWRIVRVGRQAARRRRTPPSTGVRGWYGHRRKMI